MLIHPGRVGRIGPGVTAAAESSPILDGLSASAAAAYSLRKLRSAYAGSAIRVRRSSDNAESDIGFSGNALDTAALSSHVGANDGFVVTWYDQSGNSRNKTQSTAGAQPRIVASGVVEVLGSRPAVRHETGMGLTMGAGDYLTAASMSVNLVAVSTSTASANRRAIQGITNNWLLGPRATLHTWFSANFNHQVSPDWDTVTGEVFTVTQGASNTNTSWRNGNSVTTAGNQTNPGRIGTGIGGTAGTEPFLGLIAELVEFASVIGTSDRQALERDQGAYYGITVA